MLLVALLLRKIFYYAVEDVANQGGNNLLPAETHYGANGSRQVVSFKHVAGYLPNTYNYIGTLKKGETAVFTFLYAPAAANGETTVITIDDGGAAGAALVAAIAAAAIEIARRRRAEEDEE